MSEAVVPRHLLDAVVAWFQPQRVILFGSLARGQAGSDSDIDLLVVLDDDAPAESSVTRPEWRHGGNTMTRWTSCPAVRIRSAASAASSARCLTRRALRGLSCMTGDDPELAADRRRIARRWLDHAAEDLRVARGCVTMVPPSFGTAAYL